MPRLELHELWRDGDLMCVPANNRQLSPVLLPNKSNTNIHTGMCLISFQSTILPTTAYRSNPFPQNVVHSFTHHISNSFIDSRYLADYLYITPQTQKTI